jgi:hypothetical protein
VSLGGSNLFDARNTMISIDRAYHLTTWPTARSNGIGALGPFSELAEE